MSDHTSENTLTAFCLQMADQLERSMASFSPRSEPARAIAFVGRQPALSIRELSTLLGLSHAATVRLVDRLCDDELIERSPCPHDARAVALSLSTSGMACYRAMLDQQSRDVNAMIGVLSKAEQTTLTKLMRKVLSSRTVPATTAAQGCRFCDVENCVNCPVPRDGAEP